MTIGGQQRETEGNNQANLTLPRYRQGTLIDESWQDDWTLYNAVVRYQASTFEFLSSTSFVDRGWRSVSDVSGFVAFFGVDSGTATAIHTQNLQEFTQEIRLTSTAGPGRLDWLAGLFFVDRNLAWHPSFPAPGFDEATGGQAAAAGNPDNLASGTTRFDHQQLALYGEVSIDLAPDWTVTFGGRWFRFEESSRTAVKGILGTPEPTLNSADETGFVPKVMVSWAVDPDTMLYAAATQGFRPGGPNFAAVPLPLCEDALNSIGLDAAPKSYWSASVFVDNVLDEYGIVNRVDDTGLHPSGDSQNLIQPRTIGLTVRTRFQ